MRLRTKYLLFVVLLHAIELALSYYIFRQDKIWFLVSEVFILLSVGISWKLYRELVAPLKLLTQGADAIKDRDFNVKFLPTGKYEMDKLIAVYNQMIDALRTERVRQEQQHLFLEKLIQTSPTGILILDFDDAVQQANPKAMVLLGLREKDVLGKPAAEISHPVMTEIVQLPSGHSKILTLNGAITYKILKSHFMDRGFPRHFVMLEELTTEILEAEKKAYGKVIRMMAHEVNNTIGPVNSIIQTTLQAGQHSEPVSQALQVAMERNHHLNLFMRNFADLVRLPVPEKRPFDLLTLLQNIADLLQVKAAERQVEFKTVYREPSFIVNADVHQMEQALINIITNAIEAIPGGGVITFLTQSYPAQLVIRDTGTGIPADMDTLLFSPFNSTKKNGQGIGLTLVREILAGHGFGFSLETVWTNRTEFRIVFQGHTGAAP
jgi:two-component system nitrogen regulation sensor histidine kinase NtrY